MASRHGIGLMILLFAASAQADIYKCVAEDGAVSYSQIPCPQQKSETVRTPTARVDTTVDCRWASKLANDVARRMRTGLESDAAFNMYGGIDSVSSGTINIINYVYRFRSDNSTAIERISSLAGNMCKAGSLGDVRCESLPYGEDPTGNTCDPDTDDPAEGQTAATAESVAASDTTRPVVSTQARESGGNAADREACRDNFRDQIDAIDAQMRSGYDSAQGERYRERLLSLTTRMREC